MTAWENILGLSLFLGPITIGVAMSYINRPKKV